MTNKIDLIATIVCIAGAAIGRQEAMDAFMLSGVGAISLGWVSSSLFAKFWPDVDQKFWERWTANAIIGTVGGPFLSFWAAARFPDVPMLFMQIACGGLLGFSAVILIFHVLWPAWVALVPIVLKVLGRKIQ